MKKILLFLILIQFSLVQYGQIIADHTVVDKYDDIPQYYIDKVKKMWLSNAGESHSMRIRSGLVLLEASNPTYAVNVMESGTPEAYTTSNLRASRATWGDLSHVIQDGYIFMVKKIGIQVIDGNKSEQKQVLLIVIQLDPHYLYLDLDGVGSGMIY